ncbi:hypothetical protein BJ322DRAFT_1114612 [Thelephora terrestris]|uniref:Uncharacterized protein n=1 Tax=Thelephora terrestris TaxID=56493 RepID=A0A9P6H4W2_9AGAM|nr:hypothetical protein BJ322DRAFT_1114612 [Thelephora terrestris]
MAPGPCSTPIQRKIYTDDFDAITGHLPFLKDRIESDVPSKVIRKIMNQVQSAASRARQTDTKTLKQAIITIIPQKYFLCGDDGSAAANALSEFTKLVMNPASTKSWCGWENLVTARLLCPIDNLSEFKVDPGSTRAKLRDGSLKLVDSKGDPKLPAFLYDKDLMDGSITQGLFRGPLLLAVYTHIFISPSAATGAKMSLKRGNARIHGMEKVIPSTICYAAVQAYVALCCAKEWKEEWKGIKFPSLYIFLREQFAHPDDPWSVETLKWWNMKIFGGPPETDEDPSETEQDVQGPSM